MSCWRLDLQGKLGRYVTGDLAGGGVKRVEQHLLDCGWCREAVTRLRIGDQLARQAPRSLPSGNAESEFEAVMASLQAARAPRMARMEWRAGWPAWLRRCATPRIVTALTLVVLAQSALLLVATRHALFGARPGASLRLGGLNPSDFHAVRLEDMQQNTEPQIATEGYARDVHSDEEEGTVAFKLVESPRGSANFVVCEIIAPLQIAPPREGSHVRVYGVARYDAQAGRRWYEVNPVLNIADLRR